MSKIDEKALEAAERKFMELSNGPAAMVLDVKLRRTIAAYLDALPPHDSGEFTTLRAANVARQAEWDSGNQITLAYRGNELAGEVGEACNIIKKIERERMGIAGSRATIGQLAEELADVVICTDLIAMQAGIDLQAAAVAKFNATSEKVGLRTRLAHAALSDTPSRIS